MTAEGKRKCVVHASAVIDRRYSKAEASFEEFDPKSLKTKRR